MPPRTERILVLSASLAAWLCVLLRAAWVPLIHDEAATFQTYVLTGEFLPWRAHWDAGNHLLATAATRLSYVLFGSSPLALRLFSVMCFGIWALYARRITQRLTASALRLMAFGALLLTPFLFEFFSLFRGYGPALAFLLMTAHHAIGYAQHARLRDLLLMLAGAIVASTASLTTLLLTALFFAIGTIVTWQRRRKDVRAWLVLLMGIVPFAALAYYGMQLGSRGLLYYGSDAGITTGTLGSLGLWVLGLPWPMVGALLFLLPLALAIISIRGSAHRLGLAVLTLLFTGELLGRVVLGEALGVLYPTDRTAMHLVPLAILLMAYAGDSPTRRSLPIAAPMLLALLPARALISLNFNRTSYWPEQAIPAHLVDAAAEQQRAANRPLLVGGYHQNACVWAYASMRRDGALNFMDVNGFPQPICDLLLLDPEHSIVPPGFALIDQASHGRTALYAREKPLRSAVVVDSLLAEFEGDAEYHELPAPSVHELTASTWLIDLDVRFSSEIAPLRLRVVVEVKDEQGNLLHYEANDIERLRPVARDEPLRIVRRIPQLAAPPARVVAYLWNPFHQHYRMQQARVRLSTVQVDA